MNVGYECGDTMESILLKSILRKDSLGNAILYLMNIAILLDYISTCSNNTCIFFYIALIGIVIFLNSVIIR